DNGQSVFEYNLSAVAEQNNSASIQALSAPDLEPSAVGISSAGAIVSGATVSIHWTDQNSGTVDLGSGFYDRVVVTKIDTGETLLNDVYYFDPNSPIQGVLAPGEIRTRSTSFHLPDGPLGAGVFQVTVTSDFYNSIPE